MKLSSIFLSSLLLSTVSFASDCTEFVDPLIGTGGHGHVFVGASVPYGMVQVGPTSVPEEWDWVSGYHESDNTIIGFSHTHLSGTGIGDLFDITLMPVIGEVTYARGTVDDPKSGLWSYGDRSKQIVSPSYYSVPLLRYGITAEMTATDRVGIHRYHFPTSDEAAVIIDLENGGCWDMAWRTELKAHNETTVVGFRFSSGWAKDQRVFFAAEFSEPYEELEIIDAGPHKEQQQRYARVSFRTKEGKPILAKVALSSVSEEAALKNLKAELPDWDFERVRKDAHDRWNKELSKIQVESLSEEDKRIFYTSFYHTMLAPSLFCDVDGSYFGADQMVHKKPRFTNYTTLSLWDTYRAAQPLMTLIQQDRLPDLINSMLTIYGQQGKLPVWHLMGNETNTMVGNPGIAVIADAITKDIPNVDMERAWRAIHATAMLDDRGQDVRKEFGYIPCDLFDESVAYDMEYAIADAAAAMAAKKLGKQEEYEYYQKRSLSYRHYFDAKTGFIRGKDSKGAFLTPFNPFHSSHRADVYCEGNAWQYTWLAPHDLDGLIQCFGSKEKLIAKLDELFSTKSELVGDDISPDISGMIGQYAHGNEPSHHIIYFYTMLGEPAKAADKIREVLTTLYRAEPDGIPGNEDAGQMSAWYILSALGFYQVEPAGGDFYFGSPLVKKATLQVPAGEFTIIANDNSLENKYIQSVKLNGKPYRKPFIRYEDIIKGGTLEFNMGDKAQLYYDL